MTREYGSQAAEAEAESTAALTNNARKTAA
jgi:hypothetical protein